MARFKLNTSKKGKTKKSTSSNASVRRANQRVRDAKSAGFSTTSRFTDSVRAGNTARPSSGSTDVSQGTIRENARNLQGGRETLTSDSLRSATNRIKLTSPNTQVVGDVSANNVGFESENTTSTGGVLSQVPPAAGGDKFAGAQSNFDDYLGRLQDAQGDRTTGADIQRELERESGIREARQRENDLSAQINTIIANRDASILSEEGQGRGIPESIIGGRQAKINKEAAIKALPVQALLAQAQGNVALAEAHINTWGKILMDDANNEYNQKKELLTSAYDFAQGIEFKRIDELNAANERKYQENREFIQAKTSAMANAAGQEAGQSVMSAIQSATTLEQVVAAAGKYNGDVLGREAQKASIAANRATMSLNERKFEYAKQQDALANELALLKASGELSEEGAKDKERVNQALNLKELMNSMVEHPGFNAGVGSVLEKSKGSGLFGFLPAGIGGITEQSISRLTGDKSGFDGIFDQVVEGITVDQLSKMSGPKTDKDIEILRKAAVRLKKSNSKEEFLAIKAEMDATLQRIVDNVGVTQEQAQYYYYGTDQETLQEVDTIWGTPTSSTLFPTTSF